MTQPLSQAAQAVLDAFHISSDGHYEDGLWTPHTSEQIAAALRAAVNNSTFADVSVGKTVAVVRVDTILDIAAELEEQQ